MIKVNEPYLPDLKKYYSRIERVFGRRWLTNGGPNVLELEDRLADYLGVGRVVCVSSGGLALQLVYKAFGLKGLVATSPFSFAATTSTMIWEQLQPKFFDVDAHAYNLSVKDLALKELDDVNAIVATHVYGNPSGSSALYCKASEKKIPLIFDAAHAFGVRYKNDSILNFGDASAISFHATKLFHTVEGGAVVTNDKTLAGEIELLRNFGISNGIIESSVGTNAKMSEMHAAMGLCVLDNIEEIYEKRAIIGQKYEHALGGLVEFQQWSSDSQNTYSYFPVRLDEHIDVAKIQKAMLSEGIETRRYFYPSLNRVLGVQRDALPVSESLAKRILCLPIYPGLNNSQTTKICDSLKYLLECGRGQNV